MKRSELRVLIKQVVKDLLKNYNIIHNENAVANTTANVAGYDVPLCTKPVKRKKLKDI